MADPTLIDDLRRLEDLLRTKRRRAYKSLCAPAAPDALARLRDGSFEGRLPDEIRTWFGWHDGRATDDPIDPRSSYLVCTIEGVTSAHALLRHPTNEAQKPYKPTWVPLLSNGAGDYVVYDRSTTKLVTYWHDDPERPPRAASLQAWVRELCTALVAAEASVDALAPFALVEAEWLPILSAPTVTELHRAPPGTAFTYAKKNWTPFDNGPVVVRLFVKTKEQGWLSMLGNTLAVALAKYDDYCGTPPPQDSGSWRSALDTSRALARPWAITRTTVAKPR